MFVHEVIAAIITAPCPISNSSPLYVNLLIDFYFSYVMSNPLKPTLLFKHALKSDCILARGTWSWGLFGPERQG